MEQRSALLATRMIQRKNALRDAITPPGERPPFTVAKTRNEALEFWAKEWTTPLGKMILGTYTEEQKAALEAALGNYHAAGPVYAQPAEPPSMGIPTLAPPPAPSVPAGIPEMPPTTGVV
jgi:hypothetical protein